ncbi:uncharacterized protein A4U43_C05F20890 [Asparagus officinalis]|uniref:Uncharacterized protein n=1 Tax=Asparagus officinalis TaxID=4686 RepID=A0A5P1EYL2_ASPOF|nr:uncharacterized protein A4U43_C05F20890 [Asparagus officinalis]
MDGSMNGKMEMELLVGGCFNAGRLGIERSMKPAAVQADQMPASKYNSRNLTRVERLLRERELRRFNMSFNIVEAEPGGLEEVGPVLLLEQEMRPLDPPGDDVGSTPATTVM